MANFKKVADLLSYSEKKYPDLVWIVDPAHTESLRKEQCAKVLKLSLDDISELGLLTGIDPLADDLEADTPSLFQFIAIAQRLKQASLKIVDLAYILRHTDSTGKLDPSDEALLQHIKILRDTVNAVEKENGIAPDNADFNFAKNKMLLVYDPVTTDDFFELLLNTKVYSPPWVTNEEGLPTSLGWQIRTLDSMPSKRSLFLQESYQMPQRPPSKMRRTIWYWRIWIPLRHSPNWIPLSVILRPL